MLDTRRCPILFSVVFFLGACGSPTIGDNPCEGADPEPSCGQECSAADPCPTGFYCDDGACTADCTPTGNECGDGYICTAGGQCEQIVDTPDAGPPPDAMDCPSVRVAVEPEIPTVQLLIDQSGSMTEDFGGVNRWQAVATALVDPTNGAVTQLQDNVRFGASLYSSLGGNAGGTCPLLVETMPSLNNRDTIASLLANNQPQIDTPTAESVNAIALGFPPPDPEQPGPRLIVLATDGNPDNCVDPDAHDESSQMLSEMAVQNAYSMGLETYVLSVGDDVSVPHLQRLANAGQGLNLDNGGATFYVANNAAQLVAAFNDIIYGARTCTFMLDGQVTDPTQGSVALNGGTLNYGTDWDMPNNTTLELLGDACTAFLNTDVAELTAEFPCNTIIIE